MRRELLVGALVLLAALPAPAAAAPPPWRIDETLRVVDAAHPAEREWRVQYDARVYNPRWTLTIPAGATFQNASDPHGAPLPATSDGSSVTVTTDGGEFFVTLREPLAPDGAFYSLAGGPPAASDSVTSARVELPDGWTLAGWSGSAGLGAPDAARGWSWTGPFYVEILLLPPGTSDPGPDARGAAGSVVRDATATLREEGALLDATVVYDTDTYGPSWSLPIPRDARLLSVTAPLPNVTWTADDATVLVAAPYPFARHLGPRAFTLHYALAARAFGGDYYRANLSVSAGRDDRVTLALDASGVEWVGARLGDARVEPRDAYATTGPMTLSVVFMPRDAPAGAARVREGPFVVEAPAPLADAARAAAKDAAAALPDAAPFVGVGISPVHVVYTDAPVFQWEEGLYQGHDAISIRASDIGPNATNLTAVRTLVHETTHALVDRARQGKRLENSFLNEGLARLAEAHVDLQRPAEVMRCDADRRCTRDSSRIDAGKLQDFLKSGRGFDVGWNATSAPDGERGFLYDYSGYVLLQYERRSPDGAIARALRILADNLDPTAGDVVAALLHEAAPGTTRDDLLYPGRDEARTLSPAAFATAMGDAVAPSFPESGGGDVPAIREFPGFSKTPGAPAWGLLLAVAVVAAALRRAR